jgi:hypothetical protein
MRHRQRGVTFIGWIFLLAPTAILLYAGIRLTPVYLEYMKVTRTLEQVKTEFDGNAPTATAVRQSIERHFDVEDVATISFKDVTIQGQGRSMKVTASYEGQAPLFANILLVVQFDKTVDISQ